MIAWYRNAIEHEGRRRYLKVERGGGGVDGFPHAMIAVVLGCSFLRAMGERSIHMYFQKRLFMYRKERLCLSAYVGFQPQAPFSVYFGQLRGA